MSREFTIEQQDGTSVALKDLQKLNLEILRIFDAFCVEHNIKYTFCGGCCIGTLRHEGFIPWDDDVDVHMFREDYERFYTLWKEHGSERFELMRTNEKQYFDTMLTQISDINSTFIKLNQVDKDIPHGVRLEIIPLDGAPSSKYKRKVQMVWALIFNLFNRGFVPENRGGAVSFVSRIILGIFNTPKKRVKIWKFAEKQMTKYPISESSYVSELFVTSKYMKIMYPKEIFMGDRRENFEGEKYPIPKLAEQYLKMAFGDYMKLPPLEEQIPKHDTNYIDLKTSYKQYRGKYYLIEGEENE